jgi:glyoxylase-like metal-dependent hydrolase (beta-lactamase superfamily II)
MLLAEGLYWLGSPFVNFYAIEDGGRVTIIDGGLMGYSDQVPKLLASIGLSMSDVTAVVHALP